MTTNHLLLIVVGNVIRLSLWLYRSGHEGANRNQPKQVSLRSALLHHMAHTHTTRMLQLTRLIRSAVHLCHMTDGDPPSFPQPPGSNPEVVHSGLVAAFCAAAR